MQSRLKNLVKHTRKHSFKLVKPRCHLDIRKFSFARRVVDIRNSLNDNLIACDSINVCDSAVNQTEYL